MVVHNNVLLAVNFTSSKNDQKVLPKCCQSLDSVAVLYRIPHCSELKPLSLIACGLILHTFCFLCTKRTVKPQ